MTRAQVDTRMMYHQHGEKPAAGQTQSHKDVCVCVPQEHQVWKNWMSMDGPAERRL